MSICIRANSSQDKSDRFSPFQRQRVEQFLKRSMWEDGAAYTLLGSKPMSGVTAYGKIDETEKQIIYEARSAFFRNHISLKKFHPIREDARKLWDEWKEFEHLFLGKNFLFVEEEEAECGLFINLATTEQLIDQYREDFEKCVGHSFDTIELIHSFGNSKSASWQNIRRNHYLMGLLYGFGENNSRLFQEENSKGRHHPNRISLSQVEEIQDSNPLILPTFVVYEYPDPQVEKFKEERKRIIEFYRDKDFVEATLQLLKQ